VERISIEDKRYPGALRLLETPPQTLTLWRPLGEGRVIAIVGTRTADDGALAYTRRLAGALAREGAIVASGGAFGIDNAAHEGALEAGGPTWLFAPCGINYARPEKHEPLYERIKESERSNILSVFADDDPGCINWKYFLRNAAMAALADEVVCVQAPARSGAMNTMKHARELGRPRWVAAPHPFVVDPGSMRGCEIEHASGAFLIPSTLELFVAQLLGKEPLPEVPVQLAVEGRFRAPSRPLVPEEERVLSALGPQPRHTDEIAEEVGLSAPNVATALLTLALEDVVVEGPGGFFRRN
jgi:DNA processing protein